MVDLACGIAENQTLTNGQLGRLARTEPDSTEVDSVFTLPVPGKFTKTPEPTSVYKYYDQSSVLIYVGITRQGVSRNRQHNSEKEWWPFVSRQEVEHFPSRQAAHSREIELIEKHLPPFNRQHNIIHDVVRAAYLGSADPKASQERWKLVRENRLIALMPKSVTATKLELISQAGDTPITSRLVHNGIQKAPVFDSKGQIGSVLKVQPVGTLILVVVPLKRPLVGDVGVVDGHLKIIPNHPFGSWQFKKLIVNLQTNRE